MRTILLSVGITALWLTGSAVAECHMQPTSFSLSQNDSVTSKATIDGGGCLHAFLSGDASIYTSARILNKPSHGSLAQIGRFSFAYVPAKRYKGLDSYGFMLCGTNAAGAGCARIKIDVTVQ